MLAIRLGGSGDMTDKAIRWKYQRSVPQLPSPLLFGGVLYMVNDNGIVTTLNPETGELIKQGRLTGAPGPHFASPIAADGHIFFTSEAGRRRGGQPGWRPHADVPSTTWPRTPTRRQRLPMAASTCAHPRRSTRSASPEHYRAS